MNIENEKKDSGRRAFFGRLLGAIGGGFVAGNIFRSILSLRKRGGEKVSITVSGHPMAVPRSKEGSQSHV